MRIVTNQPMVRQLSKKLVEHEMSNVSKVIQSPTILTTYFSIESDLTEVTPGYKSITDLVGSESPVVFTEIEHLPMAGLELNMESSFNDEAGRYDEDFSTSGIIFPNTVFPKPGDLFIIEGESTFVIFVVTNMRRTTVRSNPFIEITVQLYSRSQEKLKQIKRQVRETKVVVMNPISENKSLVISKKSKESIEAHLRNYAEIAQLYTLLFYDKARSAFVFDGYPDSDGKRGIYCDMLLWRMLFEDRIIINDQLLIYADSECGIKYTRVYTSCPDILVDDYQYHQSILYRISHNEETPMIQKTAFDTYRFPNIMGTPPEITKYEGVSVWYIENYLNSPDVDDYYGDFQIWDDEFVCRIRTNRPYDATKQVCDGCARRCRLEPSPAINYSLRNAIIAAYNDHPIDWDGLILTDVRSVENYYLLPILLDLYNKFISSID